MQEIIVKDNTTGLRVFINGVPDLKFIPKNEVQNTVIALEMQISEYYKRNSIVNKPKPLFDKPASFDIPLTNFLL